MEYKWLKYYTENQKFKVIGILIFFGATKFSVSLVTCWCPTPSKFSSVQQNSQVLGNFKTLREVASHMICLYAVNISLLHSCWFSQNRSLNFLIFVVSHVTSDMCRLLHGVPSCKKENSTIPVLLN